MFERQIIKNGFEQLLTVIKTTINGEVENIVIEHRSHLKFLEGARATIGKHDENSDARAPTHGMNSSRTRISASSTQNI